MEFNVNNEEQQFEMGLDDGLALLEYTRKDDKIYLTHTEVPKAQQGNGIGTKLVRHTLDYLRSQNITAVPLCSFVQHFINEHPEYADILPEGYQM